MSYKFELMQILISNSMLLLLSFIIFLAILTDLYKRKIPNSLIVFGLFSNIVGQLFLSQGLDFMQLITGILFGFICFFPLYLLRGMAAGDVKLMMVVGGFIGFPMILTAALYSYVAGGVMAIVIVLAKGKLKQALRNIKTILTPLYIKLTSGVDIGDALINKNNIEQASIGRMPYALAIAAGTFLALYFEASQSINVSN